MAIAAWLIAVKETEELETVVFEGEDGDEVVAVFTDPKNASDYIEAASWQDDHQIAELEPIAFLEWLIVCHRSGVKLLATDPKRADQESGKRISTLVIETQLTKAGEHISLTANRDF